MLEMCNFQIDGNIISFIMRVECDNARSYEMSVNMDADIPSIVSSSVPECYRTYERQARTALRNYKDKEIPVTVTAAWC